MTLTFPDYDSQMRIGRCVATGCREVDVVINKPVAAITLAEAQQLYRAAVYAAETCRIVSGS
jgi:hypothetical protein